MNDADSANAKKALDSYAFALMSEERIRAEIPDANPEMNSLLLFLNRVSADVTSGIERTVHRPLGLTWPGYRLLFVLWVAGELEPARIADLTYASRASVSSLTSAFLDDGLVASRPSTTDGRSIVLSLTHKGRQLIKKAFLAQDDVQHQMLNALTTEEREILRILLAKLMQSRSGTQ